MKHPTNKFERILLSEKKKAIKRSEGTLRRRKVVLTEQETADELAKAKNGLQGLNPVLD